MKKLIAVSAAAFIVATCTDSDGAKRHLSALGFTEIETDGYRFFGCGQEDGWRTGFTAVSPNGTRVSGVVCDGMFKGATVRFD